MHRGSSFYNFFLGWSALFDDEENVRTPPKLGRYWEIHPLRPQDFSWTSRFHGSQEISWASGMDFSIPPSFWWSTDTILIKYAVQEHDCIWFSGSWDSGLCDGKRGRGTTIRNRLSSHCRHGLPHKEVLFIYFLQLFCHSVLLYIKFYQCMIWLSVRMRANGK